MTLSSAFARMFWTVGGILILVGTGFGLFEIVSGLGSTEVTGTVVELREVQNAIPYADADSGILYYPVISYEDSMGTSKTFTSPAPVSRDEYTNGDSVSLLVAKSGVVRIESFWGRWGRAVVLAGAGVLFLIFGFGSLQSFDSKQY